MANIISAELRNRLLKMGIVKQATAGAAVEGNLGAVNTTLINSVGKETRIARGKDAYEFVDPEVQQAIDAYVLDQDGNLQFEDFRSFVDATTVKNMSRHREDSLASVQDAGNNLRFALKVITGDESFMTRPFKEVVNCIEYSTFVSVIAKIYYPEAKVRVLMFGNANEKAETIVGGMANSLFDRHAYFIFKDTDGEVYLSIYGQKVRTVQEGIEKLESVYARNPSKYPHIPKLIEKIKKEHAQLLPKSRMRN